MTRFSVQPVSIEERRAFVRMSQTSWGLTVGLLLVVVAFVLASPVDLQVGKLPLNVVTFPIFGLVALVYTYLRFDVALAAIAEAVALLSAYTFVAAVLTYVATYLGAGRPFWDETFMAADQALGFDWRAYLAWLNERPRLGWMLDEAYLSILKQVPCLIVLLALLGHHRRLQIFLLASQLCLIVCGAFAFLTPALGSYEFLNISGAVDHPNIGLATLDKHVEHVLQLRGPTPSIPLGDIHGIIVFPSFHMALAILFAWGFWAVPVVRYPALALNVAMAAATPLSGGHYLVDLIGGAVMAVAAIAAASSLRAAIERGSAARTAPTVPEGEAAVA
jgi:hypothetical protein